MTRKPSGQRKNATPVPRWMNGEPYYCNTCGLGGAEVMACEDGPCEMETREEAQARVIITEARKGRAS